MRLKGISVIEITNFAVYHLIEKWGNLIIHN